MEGRLEEPDLEPDEEASKEAERFLLCRLNGRRAFTLTIFLIFEG